MSADGERTFRQWLRLFLRAVPALGVALLLWVSVPVLVYFAVDAVNDYRQERSERAAQAERDAAFREQAAERAVEREAERIAAAEAERAAALARAELCSTARDEYETRTERWNSGASRTTADMEALRSVAYRMAHGPKCDWWTLDYITEFLAPLYRVCIAEPHCVSPLGPDAVDALTDDG